MRLTSKAALVLIYSLGTAIYSNKSPASECLTVVSVPDNAIITLKSSRIITARSPAVFCDITSDRKYILKLEKRGHETRSGKLLLSSKANKITLKGERLKRASYSMVLPGLGQFSAGLRLRGSGAFLSAVAGGVALYISYRDFVDERSRYRFFVRKERMSTMAAEKKWYREQYMRKARLTNALREIMIATGIAIGWLHLANIGEAVLVSTPPRMIGRKGTTVELAIPRKDWKKALARSALFPGMGQKYLGRRGRGLLFQAAFLATALLTLDAEKNFRIATAEYEVSKERMLEAKTTSEIESARADLKTWWDERRDREKERNAFLISLASVWVLNLVDAVTGGRQGELPLGVDSSYSSPGLRAVVKFSF